MASPKVVKRNREPNEFPAIDQTVLMSGASGRFMPTT
jgi:hypothetical protein